jgi:hypothetical protein
VRLSSQQEVRLYLTGGFHGNSVVVGLLRGRSARCGARLHPAARLGADEYERQQREYRLQQERQREQQQQQQQLMNENARRQQEQSSRINSPAGQPSSGFPPGATQGGRGADPAGAQAASAARAMWEKRPALPPDRNPLLGKWKRPPSTRPNPSDPFAAIQAMAKGGLCEVLFGGGVFEFRPDRLVGMDERTAPQELDRVEYRGDARRVVVLPRTTLKLIEFDVEGPDRINWASQKCVLVRVGAASSSASAATPASAGSAPNASAHSGSTTGGVLAFSVRLRAAELAARLRPAGTGLRKGRPGAAAAHRRDRDDRCHRPGPDTVLARWSLLGAERRDGRQQANDVA